MQPNKIKWCLSTCREVENSICLLHMINYKLFHTLKDHGDKASSLLKIFKVDQIHSADTCKTPYNHIHNYSRHVTSLIQERNRYTNEVSYLMQPCGPQGESCIWQAYQQTISNCEPTLKPRKIPQIHTKIYLIYKADSSITVLKV